MNCIVVEQVGSFRTTDRPIPRPGPDEALIKVHVAGLCRTDLKLIRNGHRDLTLPRIPGEEVVGTIEAAGSPAIGFQAGQRVYIYPGQWCGQCPACVRGHENLCRSMRIMGFHRDGGFAEYVLAPAQSLIAVPPSLSDEEAVFAEPLSCCLNALELATLASEQHLAVWGAGPAGTLLARAGRALGATVTVNDPDPGRAGRIGVPSTPNEPRADVAVVAVGSPQAYEEALSRLAPRGTLVVFSGLAPASERLPINLNRLHYEQQTLVGAYGCCFRHGEQALQMLASGRLTVRDMITHRFPLEELEEALTVVEQRTGMKVLLYPSKSNLNP
jgi:L-iditol 2-dehydrogenase